MNTNDCKCNNCEWEGNEDELVLVEFDINDKSEKPTAIETPNGNVNRLAEEPPQRDFLKGCPNCNTDAHLMNL